MADYKKEKRDPKSKNYVRNVDLLQEIAASKANGNLMSNELGRMLMLMCEKYSRKPNFGGYSYREDMVSEAIINLCANWYKFDETKFDNAFSYYTTCIHRCFLQVLHEHKKQRDIVNAYRQDKGIGLIGFNEKQGHKDIY